MFRNRQESKEDLEISITDGKDIVYDEEIPIDNIDIPSLDGSPKSDKKRLPYESDSSDSEEPELQLKDAASSNRFISDVSSPPISNVPSNYISTMVSRRQTNSSKPGPSKENTSEQRPKSGIRKPPMLSTSESESDSDDGLMIMDQSRGPLPGEYDPEKYNDLQVNEEIKELFQYITKYTPQHLNLDYKFKPFVPDYIPAVGDIDAFLKVVPPEKMLATDEHVDFSELGLVVLDEPAANQSDSALLHLQLRAVSVTTNKDNKNMIIKKIDNVEKNSKTIDKWILDVSDLHRSKPPPMVKYTNPMPDVDSLMQEWPQQFEMLLRKEGLPSHKLKCSLPEYIDLMCAIFEIPVYEKRIQSLHLLFTLYVAVKSSQLYKVGNERDNDDASPVVGATGKMINSETTDQLILE